MAIAVDEVRRLLTFLELSSSKIDETMKNDSISQTIASIALKGEEFNKNLPKSSVS